MRPRVALAFALALACPAVQPAPVTAQTIRGTVSDGVTALPIRGAFLELLDTAGKRVTASLSDSGGHFIMAVPAGAYALRAEAMGYEDAAPVVLEPAARPDRPLKLRLRPRPIMLSAIRGEAAPRCRLRKDTAGAVLVAWREARKALRQADWSMKESGLVMVARSYAYVHGSLMRGRIRDSVRVDTITKQPPYTALRLASARDHGLFQRRGQVMSFYAPGPDYILSDYFLDSHCFALHRSGKRIGLDFFPVSKGEGHVRGTLWLDRYGRALQRIDFRFGNVNSPVRVRGADGRLDFARTADGYYIIRRWRIRVPMYYRGRGRVTKVRGGEMVKSWMGRRR